MQKQIFNYNGGWDDVGDNALQFYDVTLIIDIGNFSKGDKFSEACVDYDSGLLTLYRDGSEWKFKLTLGVGDEVRD